eukprot:CAMPEP_0169336254 /NCGR_PEP_ID=MMETSP1017-20121227/16779_1 /TAXON_ID=342587 /ORGANISM="Karlodinium micrum, Strain CCMP2283" /LENGTH=117 /DNA_ID=CAMNT_0009431699 /DNA_START=208 /DNA_END=561 /DNA_ORIENTATION=+
MQDAKFVYDEYAFPLLIDFAKLLLHHFALIMFDCSFKPLPIKSILPERRWHGHTQCFRTLRCTTLGIFVIAADTIFLILSPPATDSPSCRFCSDSVVSYDPLCEVRIAHLAEQALIY